MGRSGVDDRVALGYVIVVSEMTIDAAALRGWLRAFADSVAEQKDTLTALDAEIGDADHGENMQRGMRAVVAEHEGATATDAAAVLKQAGMTLVRSVGGASGPLFGTFFLRTASALGTTDMVDLATLAKALRAGVEGVAARGKAELGDKTMYDALAPMIDALDAAVAAGRPLDTALRAASEAAAEGRDATVGLTARKGRASYLGERSVGHQDPGATSVALLFAAAAETLPKSDL